MTSHVRRPFAHSRDAREQRQVLYVSWDGGYWGGRGRDGEGWTGGRYPLGATWVASDKGPALEGSASTKIFNCVGRYGGTRGRAGTLGRVGGRRMGRPLNAEEKEPGPGRLARIRTGGCCSPLVG